MIDTYTRFMPDKKPIEIYDDFFSYCSIERLETIEEVRRKTSERYPDIEYLINHLSQLIKKPLSQNVIDQVDVLRTYFDDILRDVLTYNDVYLYIIAGTQFWLACRILSGY